MGPREVSKIRHCRLYSRPPFGMDGLPAMLCLRIARVNRMSWGEQNVFGLLISHVVWRGTKICLEILTYYSAKERDRPNYL
jgi:hypothetical protein